MLLPIPASRMMRLTTAAILLCTAAGLLSCQAEETPADYAARVGSEYLTEADVRARISQYEALRDTAGARQHIIESWITEQLLYQEARRQNLGDRPEVQQQIRERERSVLVNALIEELKEDVPPPSETSIQTYYEQHKPQLRLRQPFLRVRYLVTTDRAAAQDLRRALVSADSSAADSLWQRAVARLAQDPERARRLSQNYLPVSRLQRELSGLQVDVTNLEAGTITPVIDNNGTNHLLQIVDRLAEGTLPPLEQVREKILQQLIIQEKKLMYTREVQRLRTRARANNAIEIQE